MDLTQRETEEEEWLSDFSPGQVGGTTVLFAETKLLGEKQVGEGGY